MIENGPDCTSEVLAALIDQLTTDQMRFVVARQEYSSDKDAAEAIRVSPRTVKGWKADGAPIDDAVRLMAADGLVMAGKLRRRALARAMAIKVAGLNSDDERLRQSVATEIIEWEMGKPTQKQEVSGPEGNPLIVQYVNDWRDV